jgi:hypothetical protein
MNDLAGAVEAARTAIRADDIKRLRELLVEHPDLLTWRDGEHGEVLLQATTSYANFPGADAEDEWNHRAAAEVLLDAGALVDPRVVLRILGTGAHQMMAMFEARGALPHNLRVFACLGDLARVQGCFDDGLLQDVGRPDASLRVGYPKAVEDWPPPDDDAWVVADATLYACRLGHRDVATFLLERCIALDPDLGDRISAWLGPVALVEFLLDTAPDGARHVAPSGSASTDPSIVWQAVVRLRVMQAMAAMDIDAVRELFAQESFVLGPRFLAIQEKVLSVAAYAPNALPVIDALLDAGAAIATADPPPESHAVSYAIEYGNAAYVPSLARVWPVPNDLPHAAGMGDMAAVRGWFDSEGRPALGDPAGHDPFPAHDPEVAVQDVLDRALAWAVMNGEYAIADYLLEHGADLNTRWGTHEPSSILHECAFAGREEQVRYLLGKGIDTTLEDERYESDAEGWARFGGHDDIGDLIAGHGSTDHQRRR